jgi:hypothetical protein
MQGLLAVLGIAVVMLLVFGIAQLIWGDNKSYYASDLSTNVAAVDKSESWIVKHPFVIPVTIVVVPLVSLFLYFLFQFVLILLWNLAKILGGLLLLFLLALAMCS